jgi:hypothetical protein
MAPTGSSRAGERKSLEGFKCAFSTTTGKGVDFDLLAALSSEL